MGIAESPPLTLIRGEFCRRLRYRHCFIAGTGGPLDGLSAAGRSGLPPVWTGAAP